MEMRQYTSSSSSGLRSKGAVFSIDAALGIFLAVIIIAAASYYSVSAEDALELKQMQRVGYDAVSIMNYLNLYESMDNVTIHDKIANITSGTYRIKLNITGNFPAVAILTNNTINKNSTVVSGAVPITLYNSSIQERYYGIARFYIWPR